jgi:hypothetical protein
VSSAATVRAIGEVHGLLGVHYREEDCRVPSGARLVELKQCESCPKTFVRFAGSGQKYCYACGGRMLLPDPAVFGFREALPEVMDHTDGLPHYDDSLLNEKL